MDAGERPAGRWATLRYRLWFGKPRAPLEPHSPWRWLVRSVAWFLLSLGFATVAASTIQGDLLEVGLLLLVLAAVTWGASLPLRPTPLVLMPSDDES